MSGRIQPRWLVGLMLLIAGCGGGVTEEPAGPTIAFIRNDFYDLEASGPTFVDASNGVLSNDPGATVVVGYSPTTTAGGSVVVNPDGSFTYTPPGSGSGSDSFTFRSEYAGSGSTRVLDGTVQINFGAFRPTATGGSTTVLEEASTGPQSAGGTDPNGDPITFNLSTGPSNATSFTFLTDGTYSYTGVTDFAGVDSFTYTVTDSTGRTSTPGTITINVTEVNDAPSLTVTGNLSVADGTAITQAGFATYDMGPPSEDATQTAIAATVTCTNTALFTVQPALATPSGDLTFTTAGATGGSTVCSATVQDDGGTANGGVDTSPAVNFTITITDVNNPPVINPAPGPYTFLGNTTLTVTTGTGLLANFTDPGDAPADNPHPTEPIRIVSAPAGTLTTSLDGSFTYTPAAGSRTSDSFQYVVRDDGGTASGGVDTSTTITVSLTFDGMVWWVDNSVAGPGTGLQTDPFSTIALAEAATDRQAGDTFRVRRGTGTDTGYDTGFTLQDGDKVIGEGVALTSGGNTIDPANGSGGPILSVDTSGTHVLQLAANNTVSGLTAGVTSGSVPTNYAMFGSAAGAVVTTSVTIQSSAGGGVRLLGLASGTNMQFTSLQSINGEHGLRLEGDTGGTGTASFSGTVLVNSSTSTGVLLDNTDMNVSMNNTATSLAITNTAGGMTVNGIGSGQEATLTLGGPYTISGSSGLIASNAHIDTPSTGTRALVSNGGPALSLNTVNVGTSNSILVSTLTAMNPPSEGVSLNGVEGTVTISSGNIQSPQTNSAVALRVQDSPATTTLTGVTITSTAQPVTGVQLSGTTGGSVTVNNLTVDLDVAGSRGFDVVSGHPGVTVNTATIDVSGGAGAGNAVNVVGVAGSAFTFNDVTLTAATGSAFVASGSAGSLNVGGTSAATSSGGRAVDIDMPVGGSGITFNTVNATGGDIGVRLLNTSNVTIGNTGGGSTLDGQTANGVLVQDSSNVTVNGVVVQNCAATGMQFTRVNGLTVDGADLIDNGDAASEHGVALLNSVGTASISGTDFLRSGASNVDVTLDGSDTTLLNLTVTNGTYTQSGAPGSAVNSLNFSVADGAQATVVVTSAGFLDQGTADAVTARVDGTTAGSGAGTLNLSIGASTFATAANAVDIVKDEDASLTTVVENSTFSGCTGDCVKVSNPGATNTGGSMDVTIRGNTLGSLATAGSASSGGRGIAVDITGAASETVRISGNTVQRSNGASIALQALTGSGTTNADVLGNTALSDASDGIRVQVGGTRSLCVQIGGNNDSTPFAGFDAYLLEQLDTSTAEIQGTAGDAATEIGNTNLGIPITVNGTVTVVATDCVP